MNAKHEDHEEELLRSVTLQNAESILFARRRAEEQLVQAKEALERKTEELARSLAMTRAILESTTDGILVTDVHGDVTGFNQKYAEMWRLPRDVVESTEARGRLFEICGQQFVAPEKFLSPMAAIDATSPPESFDLLELADGRVFERFSKTQIVDGQNVGRVWSFRDITERTRAEEALRKQSEWLKVTLESIGDAVMTADTQGRITSVNPVAEDLLGWRQREVLGVAIDDVFHIVNELTRLPVENPVGKVLSEGKIVGLANHTILISRDGTERAIDDSAAPIRDPRGSILGVVLVFRDVTEKHRAEMARQHAEQNALFLAEASAALAELTDHENTLQKVARAAVPRFADWCGVDIQPPQGTPRRLATIHLNPDSMQLLREIERRYPSRPADAHGSGKVFRTGESDWAAEVSEARLASLAHDEEHLRLLRALHLRSYICVPLTVRGNTIGTITFATERGRVYSSQDLVLAQDLAGRSAVAIESANLFRELRSADRRKDEFLAMLAHELRNPLTPLRNALTLVRGGQIDDETIQLMERQIEHLVRLVDDLLDVSRIMQGKIELRREPIELAAIVSRALETSQPLIDEAGHRLSVILPPGPIVLNGDLVRLTQVVTNLLNNAAKYSEPGGRIALTVERDGDEGVSIKVRDTGMGIDAEFLPQIFDLFTQAERSIERAQGGLGIGLTLVQSLVEMHGGTVSAVSAGRGQGSTFTVGLPVLPASTPAKGVSEWKPTPTRNRRVLVVEDMVGSARILAKMLRRFWGHTVEIAHDGISALEAAKAFRPDLVLLDLGLPGMNGYEVARRLREQPEHSETLLVALTGYGQESDRRRTAEAGFDEHLTKPPSVDSLELLFAHPKLEGVGSRD